MIFNALQMLDVWDRSCKLRPSCELNIRSIFTQIVAHGICDPEFHESEIQ
jgi:hypothetical protein